MIRRTETGLYRAECNGALDCTATSKPAPRKQAARVARRAGWSVHPGLLPDDHTEANLGITICPKCLESMRLATLDTVDTGSNDAPPKVEAATKSPRETMDELVRKIRETMREQNEKQQDF